MSEKKIFLLSMTLFLLLLAAIALPTYVVLNHKTTFKGLLSSVPEREYNAIIAKTQDYNAAILGSSMSECFKCSELDKVMKCNSLKLTINGCNFAEAGFMADYAAKYKKLDVIMMDYHLLMFAPNFNISSEHDLKNMPMDSARERIFGQNVPAIPGTTHFAKRVFRGGLHTCSSRFCLSIFAESFSLTIRNFRKFSSRERIFILPSPSPESPIPPSMRQ